MNGQYARLALMLCAATPSLTHAAQNLTLPAWVCAHPDAIFTGGFETGEIAVPHSPSNGNGGATGSVTRTLHIANLGNGAQPYYLYVPANYTPTHPWPFLLALHGVSPYPDTYAATTRDDWITAADAGGFIVAAPIANDPVSVNGQPGVTWLVPPTAGPNDYDAFAAVLADVEGAYNIERTRIYVWGFSAGASVAHDLGVNTYSAAFNASTMAAYSAFAGALAGLACQGLSDAQCTQLLLNLPRKITVDLHIGNNDYLPLVVDVQSDYQRFQNVGWLATASPPSRTLYYTIFVGGHDYSVPQLAQIWGNLCRAAVVP